MSKDHGNTETVDLLQELGLKEYEARCLLALTKTSTSTAKEISEASEVPRTRVYDAIRVLQAKGLVEVQHSSPQEFRAVTVDEAIATLRRKYETRLDALEGHLESLEAASEDEAGLDRVQEVWSLSGHEGIKSRTLERIEDADSEILLLVVDESLLSQDIIDALNAAVDRGTNVIVGGFEPAIVETIGSAVPNARLFETQLDWLVGPDHTGSQVAIGRLLLVDQESVLVSSYYPGEEASDQREQAVYATGLGNGVVVLIRRLISAGLLSNGESSEVTVE